MYIFFFFFFLPPCETTAVSHGWFVRVATDRLDQHKVSELQMPRLSELPSLHPVE